MSRHPIVVVIAAAIAILMLYYLTSPYQQCMRRWQRLGAEVTAEKNQALNMFVRGAPLGEKGMAYLLRKMAGATGIEPVTPAV